jgi:hypothetical protein
VSSFVKARWSVVDGINEQEMHTLKRSHWKKPEIRREARRYM